jgi:hypothetical protein
MASSLNFSALIFFWIQAAKTAQPSVLVFHWLPLANFSWGIFDDPVFKMPPRLKLLANQPF